MLANRTLTSDQVTGLEPGRNRVNFESDGYQLAGDLYLPDGFDPTASYPTIVFTRPGTQVKEQTGAVYGHKMAARGYALLAFDPRNFGDSEGTVRNQESIHYMAPNTSDAVSFLRTLAFVDRNRFYGLGLCAGSPYICNVAMGDSRIKAVATVVGNFDAAASLFGGYPAEAVEQMMAMAADGRQRYYETGEYEAMSVFAGMPMPPPDDAPATIRDTYEYYFVRAGQDKHPNYSPEYPVVSLPLDPARVFVGQAAYFRTPFLVIAGSEAFTRDMDRNVYDIAAEPKRYLEIEGASHMDLYDLDPYVDQAADAIDDFYTNQNATSS